MIRGRYKIIIVLLLLFVLTSCNYHKDDSSRKTDEVSTENEMLTFELASIKETMQDYEVLIRELTSSVDALERERKILEEFIDNSREIELTDSSIFRLQTSYFFDSMVSETLIESNGEGFYLEEENIYDFIVSDDGKYIAILFFDMLNFDEQKLIVYTHDGSELYKFSINDFRNRIADDQTNGDEVISFYGFSDKSEYLWGGLAHQLDVGIYYSINMSTGEFAVYGSENYEEYEKLLKSYHY